MEPFTRVTGAVAALDRANVDTDQIMPKQFLKRIERTGFGEFLFYDWRRDEVDFPLARPEVRPAPILVTGENFGSGSSREHAPWGLQDWGFRVIVAPSFGDIFRGNCAKIGLLTVELPADACRELIDASPAQATVDLEAQTVTLASRRVVPFLVDPRVRENLLHGWDDISLTLMKDDLISAYERDREREGPNVLATLEA
jgi:3-isopropylmalate/(R)-2-methylmalate dehydratase small subunit